MTVWTDTKVCKGAARLLRAGLLALMWAAFAAQAQNTPLRILVGFPPGGGSDAIARILAERLHESLGVPVVVENRAGAGGQLAAQALRSAPADGNTVFLSHDHTISILPQVVRNPGFDPARDFVPVAGFATFVNVYAVSGGTPAKTFAEYVAWLRANSAGKGTVGVPAPASVPEFLVKLIGQKYGVDLQAIPYRGSAPMMLDMLGNQIAAGVASVPDFIDNLKAGKLRVVAVMGSSRHPALPDVPTFAELGFSGFEELPYYGLFAPAGTPAAAITRLSDAVAQALQQPDVKSRLTAMGLSVGYMSPQQLGAREQAYTRVWAGIIQRSGFVAQ
jgi:tripartite-type tricarboxylate transporter receptor subunit TctC